MDAARRKTIHDAMVRLADGDRTAMNILVHELWPVVLTFAQRSLHHEQDAEDVAQEVFFRICSRIADFEPGRDGVSWAFGIASYEIMTQRRRRGRRKEHGGEGELNARADPSASQEDLVIRSELFDAVTHAIGDLSHEDKSSLGLVSGAARELPAATQRKRRQRALDRLRLAWRKLYGEP